MINNDSSTLREFSLRLTDKKGIKHVINFGYDMIKMDQLWIPEGFNGKMTDISAVYILQYLTLADKIIEHQRSIYFYAREKIKDKKCNMLYTSIIEDIFPSCIPIIFNDEINGELRNVSFWEDKGIEAKKYYKPLQDLHSSAKLYQSIVCFPCHLDIHQKDVDRIISFIS